MNSNNELVNVRGDLYNKDLRIFTVSKVKYCRHTDKYGFSIRFLGGTDHLSKINKSFDTEEEGELYRDEFVYRVCNQ